MMRNNPPQYRALSEQPTTTDRTYPTCVCFIFIFNIIVGTGALTLPAVFAKAGWLLGTFVIVLLAFISYITVTFIIETMACANAVSNWQQLRSLTCPQTPNDREHEQDNDTSLLAASATPIAGRERRRPTSGVSISSCYYKLDQKFELGEMAALFFNDFGRVLFYLCISTYLYGDLSIYSAAITKTIRDLICTPSNITALPLSDNASIAAVAYLHVGTSYYATIGPASLSSALHGIDNDAHTACWTQRTLTRLDVYKLLLLAFTLVFGPLSAFSVQKTKYLQILTSICRWLAFALMIALAIKSLCTAGVRGHPPAFNFYGLPALFGAVVYSFMCHHSLPSLLQPLDNKLRARQIINYDYVLIATFYLLLTMTGIFAFEHLEDLYTLNFMPDRSGDASPLLLAIDYFLALFPVFTLSASYPIIAITLRNNLQTLFLDMSQLDNYIWFVRRMLFPLLAVVPSFLIAYGTQSLTSLVAFTGTYAGAGIQYLLPVALVYYARRTCAQLLGNGVHNLYASPFKHTFWLAVVGVWSVATIVTVSLNLLLAELPS